VTGSIATAQKVAEAHAKLRARPDIQFDFPPSQHPSPPPAWLKWLSRQLDLTMPSGSLLFWVLIGVIAALILYLVARWLSRLEGRTRVEPEAEADIATWRPEEKAARALLAEADAMAEAGNFGEALHLLLQRGLEDIVRRRPRLLRPALTSREIAALEALPRLVRSTFATMAAAVERSLFAGRTIGRATWEEARAAYTEFALPGSWT